MADKLNFRRRIDLIETQKYCKNNNFYRFGQNQNVDIITYLLPLSHGIKMFLCKELLIKIS